MKEDRLYKAHDDLEDAIERLDDVSMELWNEIKKERKAREARISQAERHIWLGNWSLLFLFLLVLWSWVPWG